MTTDTQQHATSQYRLPLFGYFVTCVMLLTACRTVMGDATAMLNLATRYDAQATPHTTEDGEAARTSPIYWISGNNRLATGWECTNRDLWLATVTVVANLWMGWEYWRYVRSCSRELRCLPDGLERTHALQLRCVFLQCIFIHIGIGVLVWWLPAYWILAGFVVVNAWQTRRLNSTKIQIMSARAAASSLADAATANGCKDNPQLAVHDRLDRARDLLTQRVPYAGG